MIAEPPPPPVDPDGAPHAVASAPDHRAARRPPRRHARWFFFVVDRVPTSWGAGILTVVFIAATAAFGGLNTVVAPPLPELSPGDEHVSAQLALTVERAVLIDEFPEAGVDTEPGERVLALVVTAENRWDRPLSTGDGQSVSEIVRVGGLGDAAPDSVARYDDATFRPWLQPRVPARLVLTWAVEAETFTEGDELDLELRDLTLQTGQLVTAGQWWDTPVPAAHLGLAVEDVGAGASAEGEAE